MKTILLVEDEAIIAMSTAKMIEKHGLKVATANNGKKAVEIVEKEPNISLILMDIDLGKGMDGTEAAQKILEKHDLPIIFHTSHAEKEYVDKVKKITGYGYVLKNSGEFVLIESINMAYTLFEAKKEAQLKQKESEIAYQETEAREYRLQHVNRVLLSIRNINQIITKETEVPTLLDKACRVLIETSGYHKAWIVLIDNGGPQEPLYHSGFEEDFSPMERLLKVGTLPQCAAEAIDKNDIHIVNKPSTECPLCPFKDEYSGDSCGYGEKVTMTMPLMINETVYGWISVILSKFFSENPDEHMLFREIACDLAYALHNMKIEETQRLLARDLNLTQATLMTALDNSHAGIAIADAPAGKLRYVNDAALRIQGGNRKEIVEGVGIDQYVASWNILDLDGRPLDTGEVPLARALMYGEINSKQFIVRRDDLEERTVMVNAAPIYDEEGKVNSAIVIFIDVTEHKKTERKLIESEEKYKALYENAPLPYQSLDRDGNFIDVNPAWLNTLGYIREEVIGNKFADFLHPSWKPQFEKNFPAFKKRGYVHDVQFKIRHKSGEYRDITFEGCIGYKPDGSVRQTYCVFKDRTEQKQAEEELQENKENLRITLNSIGDAVITTDTHGNITRMNPVAENLCGWDRGLAQGRKLHEVFHIINAETREIVDNPVEEVLQRGEIVGLGNHTVLISKNGYEYQIADSAAPIKDDEGNINGVVLVFRDVTEQYEKDRQIKKNNALLEETQQLAHIGSWELDLVTYQLSWSDEIYRIFGLQPQEFGDSYEAFLEAVHPEDREKVDEAYTNSIQQNQNDYEIEHRIIRKDTEEIRYVHEKCTNIKDDKGSIVRSVGMIQDLTERKRVEEALRTREEFLETTINSIPHPFYVIDVDTYEIKMANIAASDTEAIGRKCYQVSHKQDSPCRGGSHPCPLEMIRQTNKSVVVEHLHFDKNGKTRNIEVYAFPVFDKSGALQNIVENSIDITERKQREEELEETCKEKDFLLKELNHRVKNNLALVSSLINLKDSETEEDLSDLKHRIDVIKLVHKKLYQQNDVERIEVKEYFQELLESIFSSTSKGDVELANNIADVKIPTKTAIPLALVVNEIATNAIKYGFSDKEEAIFYIKMIEDRKHSQYELTLSNTGNPFPENINIENSETFGMSLVTSLVAQLGGTIDLQKEPNSVFTIRFPVEEE